MAEGRPRRGLRERIPAPLHRLLGESVHRCWRFAQVYGAIHPGSARSDAFGSIGDRSIIAFPPAALYGQNGIHIGDDTLIAQWVSLGAGYPYAAAAPERSLIIGNRCVIGIRSGITAHESIVIEDDVWLGQEVFISDSNHGFDDLDAPIGTQMGEHRPVRIGEGSWLGHGVVVLAGVTIGRHAVVAAGAVVTEDVPDRAIAAGVPARIVKRGIGTPTDAPSQGEELIDVSDPAPAPPIRSPRRS